VRYATRMKRALFLLLIAACASSVRNATLSRANIGSKYARQTGYFAACGARCDEETTRGGIRHDAILDEIVLAKVDDRETCFDVVVRTEEGKDEPLTELEAQCEIDGSSNANAIESEVVSVFDHNYTGQQNVAVVEGVAASEYVGLAMSRPAEMVFRVIERRGQICCARPATAGAALKFRNKHFDYGASKGRLEMRWKLTN
jgi:hypothetical protein